MNKVSKEKPNKEPDSQDLLKITELPEGIPGVNTPTPSHEIEDDDKDEGEGAAS